MNSLRAAKRKFSLKTSVMRLVDGGNKLISDLIRSFPPTSLRSPDEGGGQTA
jgi:hypothetical protein